MARAIFGFVSNATVSGIDAVAHRARPFVQS
jgi:hypothetical protein